MSASAQSAAEYRKRQSHSLVCAAKTFCGPEFENDSGEMFRRFRDRETFLSGCRIVHYDPFFPIRFQDNVMSHVPVQDRWQTQLTEMAHLDSQRPAYQPQVSCYFFEVAESDTFQRYRVAAPQAIQVSSVSMIGRYHGETCQPALCRLRLPDNRKKPASAEVQ
jgi:hypothetical protein